MIPLICDPLSTSFTVKGHKYSLNTDFRRWLICAEIMDSPYPAVLKCELCALTVLEKRENIPEEHSLAFLLSCASFLLRKDVSKADFTPSHTERESLLDFSADAELIFASFMAAYHIDLTTEKMHWFKFMALLSSLPESSPLMRTIALRQTDPSNIEDDRLRKEIRRAKNAVRLKPKERNEQKWTET